LPISFTNNNNNNNNMTTTLISPYTINVFAAGRRTRENIAAETGVDIKITDKSGGTNGTTVFSMNLTGNRAQNDQAKTMLGEAIERMEQWAEYRKNNRTQQRRDRANYPKPIAKNQAPIVKAVNAFACLGVEELPEPAEPVEVVANPIVAFNIPDTKLSKKERQAQNRRFVPLILVDEVPVLPLAPKFEWGAVDEDDSDDSGEDEVVEDDGFTVVKRR